MSAQASTKTNSVHHASRAEAAAAAQPPENVLRGFLLALLALPAGVIVFTLIWNLGFIASIVGFGVAFARLLPLPPRFGWPHLDEGRAIVTAVTLVTLVLAFISPTCQTSRPSTQEIGISWIEVLLVARLRSVRARRAHSPEVLGALGGNAALTLLFGRSAASPCCAVRSRRLAPRGSADQPSPPVAAADSRSGLRAGKRGENAGHRRVEPPARREVVRRIDLLRRERVDARVDGGQIEVAHDVDDGRRDREVVGCREQLRAHAR